MPADRKSTRHTERRQNQSVPRTGSPALSAPQWTEVIAGSADFIAMTDPQAGLTFLNLAGRKMAGLSREEDIQGRPLAQLYTDTSAALIADIALPQAKRDGSWSGETCLHTTNGHEIPLLQVIGAHKDEKGRVLGYATLAHDISARQHAEESAHAMDQGLERQARLLDLAHDAIIVREFDGRILYWNEGAASKYGWTKQEAIGKTTHALLRTVPGETREKMEQKLLADGFWEGELVHTNRKGNQITVASRQILDRTSAGMPSAVLEINRNITDQKESERRLRASEEAMRELTGRLLESQDEERQRISRELHDTTSQILTGILSRLYLVRKSAQSLDEPTKQALAAALKLSEGLADFIRIFSSSLHPSILEEQGLGAAIRWYADGIAAQSKLRVNIEVPRNLPRLSQNAERSLYRLVQESISRLRLSSASTAVNVRLSHSAGVFTVEIGEESGRRTAAPGGNIEMGLLGLGAGAVGMRERMRQLGGQLEVQSSDRGTVIRAVLPVGQAAGAPATASSRR